MQDKLLESLCSNLERELNERNETSEKITVEFFSGLKPNEYFLPSMHIGTTKSTPTKGTMAWFVEISIDKKVIFRESCVPKQDEDLEIIEGMLRARILRNIFTFGVMTSKSYLEKLEG